MNPDNGHLVKDIGQLSKEEVKNYFPVPVEFNEDAKKALGNKDEVYVDMQTKGKLQEWAKNRKLFKRDRKKKFDGMA